MWSMVSKSPYTSDNLASALTLHKGRILTMSLKGEVSTFDSKLCQWTALKDMNMSEDSGPRIIVTDNNILYSVVDFKSSVQQRQYVSGLNQQASQCTVFSYDPSSKWERICEFGLSPLKSAAVVGGSLFVHTGEKTFKLILPVETKVVANTKLEENTKLPPAQTTTEFKLGTQAPATFIAQAPTVQSTRIPGKQTIFPQKIPGNIFTPQFAIACASPTYAGSTLHAIKDTLFSFGGRDEDNQPTSDVLRYNPDTDTWESAGYMRNARYNVAVATVQDAAMDVIVLGGSLGSSEHIMTQRLNPPNEPVIQASSNGGMFGRPSPQTPPTWDNKTSIIEKCTVN